MHLDAVCNDEGAWNTKASLDIVVYLQVERTFFYLVVYLF